MQFNINKDKSVTVTSETTVEAVMLFNLVMEKRGTSYLKQAASEVHGGGATAEKNNTGNKKYKKQCPYPECGGKKYKGLKAHIRTKHVLGGKVGWHKTGIAPNGRKHTSALADRMGASLVAARPELIDA